MKRDFTFSAELKILKKFEFIDDKISRKVRKVKAQNAQNNAGLILGALFGFYFAFFA